MNHIAAAYNEVERAPNLQDQRVDSFQSFDSQMAKRFAPWANEFTLDVFEAEIRRFMSTLFTYHLTDGVRWGFKEIRYNN